MNARSKLLAFAVFAAIGVSAQEPKPAMKTFALLFRAKSGHLSEADLKRRAEAVRTWAAHQNAAGHKLDPRSLGAESVYFDADRKRGVPTVPPDGPLTTILFVEAESYDDAVRLAEGHPGLEFGATVEVRSWAPPTPTR